ncbi:MAG: sugar ABC transporter permease [Defluviitaleaceae bacterium]|nr:sugar ABC transporter permease [Defluviitaleaceae bacterium]
MKEKKSKNKYAKYGYLFSLPFMITFLVFSLYPIIYTFMISFSDLQGVATGDINMLSNPFQNYMDMFNNQTFRTSLQNTVVLWISNFIPQIVLATVLAAWFTNKQLNVKNSGFFKTLFYMPNIITAASIAILFGALFGAPTGPFNDLFMRFGFIDSPVHWFRNPTTARATVAFIQFWMWYGSTMIIMIAGINGINPALFEAAAIDGATGIQTFLKVTLPQLKPIVLFTLVTSFIGGMQMFDIPMLLVDRSGPDNATLTAAVFVFNQAFGGARLWNRAAAASVILFVVCGIIAGSLFFFFRDQDAIAVKKAKKKAMNALKEGNA